MKRLLKNTTTRISLIVAVGCSLLLAQPVAAQYYEDDYYNNGDNSGYQNNNGYYDDRYDNGDYQQFYDDLAPHGNWMQDPTYGYVWAPRVGRDFRPYFTNGRWAMTDLGNMWVSSYSWGAIPFHYGRWVQNAFYGWLWIPGRQWAPSWVVWRQSGAHYGWAPMGPGVNMGFGWNNYYADHMDYWNFVPYGNLYGGYYNRYRFGGVNINFFRNTTIINNYNNYNNNRFFAGPRATDVRRVSGRDVRIHNISRTSTRGRNSMSGNSIRVYSPEVGVNRSGRSTAPRNVSRIESSRATARDASVGRDFRSNVRSGNTTRGNGRENSTVPNNRNNRNNRSGNERNVNNGRGNNERTISPSNNRGNINDRTVSPSRNTQPSRISDPSRSGQPSRNISPSRNNAPTERTISPSRNSQPGRNTAPARSEIRSNNSGVSNSNRSVAPARSERSASPSMRSSGSSSRSSSFSSGSSRSSSPSMRSSGGSNSRSSIGSGSSSRGSSNGNARGGSGRGR